MPVPTKEELLFGRIAIHNKIISQEQYDECLAVREKPGNKHDLGSIVRSKGFVNERQYRSVRKAQEKHLCKNGATEDQARRIARGHAGTEVAARPEPEQVSPAAPAAPVEASSPVIRLVDSGGVRPGDASARQTMLSLLKKTRQMGASDLHLSCGSRPFMRLHGSITPFKKLEPLDDATNQRLISSVMSDADWAKFYATNDWDGCLDLGDLGRYRTNVLRQRRGVSACFRVIKETVPSLEALGLPESLERFTTFHQGLVLVTGPTGSGKSSTLAALIEVINKNRKDHVITLEDPIEFIFESKQCNITQRQIELHTESWTNALRAALREDPDIIMVGEMRDLDTVRLAITAAETGHLVFGTLHTTNATRTIDRVLDVFPPKEQAQIRAMVSESLKGVVSQQLIPRSDGKGRVCAFEVLLTTTAVAHLIRERRTFQLFSVMQTGRKQGMRLMDESLKEFVTQGLISVDEARARATNPKLFR
jgi:twitching motility protein PilT